MGRSARQAQLWRVAAAYRRNVDCVEEKSLPGGPASGGGVSPALHRASEPFLHMLRQMEGHPAGDNGFEADFT